MVEYMQMFSLYTDIKYVMPCAVVIELEGKNWKLNDE